MVYLVDAKATLVVVVMVSSPILSFLETYSTAGTQVEHVVCDERDCVMSMTEYLEGQTIEWQYVYDSSGFFLYRKHNIGSCYSYVSDNRMPGTDLNYSSLAAPVSECVGFTLEYEVKELRSGTATGERTLYLFDGNAWNAIGTFPYNEYKAIKQEFVFNYPTTVEAFATPRVNADKSSFAVEQNLADVWVADYYYVAPLGHAAAPISQFALSKREPHTHHWNDWVDEIAAGCETPGIQIRSCSDNPEHREARIAAATGHEWMPATYLSPARCKNCGATEGEPDKVKISPTLEELRWLKENGTQPVVSSANIELRLPTEQEFLSTPYRAEIYNGKVAGSIFLIPIPDNDIYNRNGNLCQLFIHEQGWVVAEYGPFSFFIADDGRMGWNGSVYFHEIK